MWQLRWGMGKKDKKKGKKKDGHQHGGVKPAKAALDLRKAELPGRPKPMKPADIRALRESSERQPGAAGAAAERQLECGGELGAGHPRAAAGHAEAAAHREEESGRAAGLSN